jgi:RHS repeat-associated protein
VTTLLDLDLRGELSSVLVAGDTAYLPGMASLGSSDGVDWTATLADAQGSVLATVDAAGTMGPIARYDPYGGPRPSTTLPVGIGFTGEWTDPVALIDLRARAYDPSLQRFLSRDTFGGIPTLPATGNRHAYALGDPLRHTDPSGHFVAALGGWDAILRLAGLGIEPTPIPYGPSNPNPLCRDIRIPCYGGVVVPYELRQRAERQGDDLGGWFEGFLDVLGFTPIGDPIDLGRGFFDAALFVVTLDPAAAERALLNFTAAIPFGGSFIKQGAKHGDDVVEGVGGLFRRACSFAGSTGVLMADGSVRAISEVEPGDHVVAVDPATGERSIETVTAVISHEDDLVVLRVEGGSLVTTDDHPFWDATDGLWEQAGELGPTDRLLAADGDTIRVLGIVVGVTTTGTAWNLTVTGPHTYHVAVGDEPVLVHNECGPSGDILQRISREDGGLKLSGTVSRQLAPGTARSEVISRDDIVRAVRDGVWTVDPQGAPGRFMFRTPHRNGTLEVLVDDATGTVEHVLYRSSRKR